jgi:hemolysin activation/secretion protein
MFNRPTLSTRCAWPAACLLALSAHLAAATAPAEMMPATQPTTDAATRPTVVVRTFRFEGNTRFSDAELARVVARYTNRPITVEDLEDARLALTRRYVEKGYINSGAILPDQAVENGVVTFRIVEGKLSEIRLTGNQRLRPGYVTRRLEKSAEPVLNLVTLRDRLELLRQDPNLRSIQAELRPGLAPGEGVLDVKVNEAQPFQLGVVYSNRRPPSVGSTAIDIVGSVRNPTGFGDLLAFSYDVANGPLDDLELAGAEDFSVDYTVPISYNDTTLSFSFQRTDSVVVETPFENLAIGSDSDSFALTVRHPLYRRPVAEPATQNHRARPAVEVAVFASAALRDNQTTLLGEPFEFAPGTDDGRSRVAVLRLGQELITRGPARALSVRSTFSIGLDVLGATSNGEGPLGRDLPDGQFLSWLGQVQYVQRLEFGNLDLGRLGTLPLSRSQLVLRGAGQLSSSPLLAIEQFAVGGIDTVRGYRENRLVRDQGFAASAEMRLPLISNAAGEDVLAVLPFFDIGYARDRERGDDGETLSSLGLGVVFTPERRVSLQVYYGYPMTNQGDSHQDLQDIGLHFNFSVYAF